MLSEKKNMQLIKSWLHILYSIQNHQRLTIIIFFSKDTVHLDPIFSTNKGCSCWQEKHCGAQATWKNKLVCEKKIETTDHEVLHPGRSGPEGHRRVHFRPTLWEGWRWVSISIQRARGPGCVQHDLVHCCHGAVEASQLLLFLPLGDAEAHWALCRAPPGLSRRAGGQPSDGPRGANLSRVAKGPAHRPGVTPSGATLSRYSFPYNTIYPQFKIHSPSNL